MLSTYKQHFAEALGKKLDHPVEEILALIEIPPENIPGDFGFPCFQLSKILKKSPLQIADDLEKNLTSKYFSSFQNMNGYLNAFINQGSFTSDVFSPLHHGTFAPSSQEKIMVEYMSANPNKPLHIGQARNICIGDSMRRLYEDAGHTVHTWNYGDDSGVNVGYNIVGHLYYNYPLESEKKFDHYCGKIYEEMRHKEEDDEFKKLLSETLIKIEEGSDPEIKKLHHDYTRKCALEQIKSCWRMNSYFDVIGWETDILHLDFFAETIDLLKAKGFLTLAKDGDAKGCWILDLSSLPAYAKEEKKYQILIKSDGTATYIAKDIAFASRKLGYLSKDFGYEKFTTDPRDNILRTTISSKKTKTVPSDFGHYDKAITVIDNRQLLPQQIVQSALTLLDSKHHQEKYIPLGYGVVYLTPQTLIKLGYPLDPEDMKEKRLPFSSRKGRTVTLDEMLEMLHTKAYQETKERNPDKDETRYTHVAETLAVSSLRFFLIRSDISKDLVFDIDEVLDMQGETGAYILYTGARMQSVIDHGDVKKNPDEKKLSAKLIEPEEFHLIKKISQFDEIIRQATDDGAPHIICRFLLDLCKGVNSYYANVHILKSEDSTKAARIFLLQKTREILQKGIDIIGMKFLERM